MTREQAAVAWAEASVAYQNRARMVSRENSKPLLVAEEAARMAYLAVRDQPDVVTPEKRLAERLAKALAKMPCNHRCLTHGYGCGVSDATCSPDPRFRCVKCAALAAYRAAKEGK